MILKPVERPPGRTDMARILSAMSGGVDSAAAALLLCRAGYAVTGVTFRLWDALGDGAERRAAAVCEPG